ncbi:spore coat protein CotJB [Thermovenabulum gondwanense]|uniref:Protein CotJB domain-containing protein n=1 Tax=Thermovenabulum gondwanense TaxID=520767 RepID=A0A162MAC3_9FIRM|nr:spore coat protein CotJB [Thermovenabulum gondwanense]KYO64787.1 hypothetical protein ATZ99_18450 [Thermovenabulum gondwanense]
MSHHNKDMVDKLKNIMAVDFAVWELSLFLDTHPDERRAIEDHNKYVRLSYQLKNEYESTYGPMRLDSISPYPYKYINSPWPWEIEY